MFLSQASYKVRIHTRSGFIYVHGQDFNEMRMISISYIIYRDNHHEKLQIFPLLEV